MVDSADAKTTEKDKKRTLLRETLQKIRHDIEVLTIKIILKDDPCFVETAKQMSTLLLTERSPVLGLKFADVYKIPL